MTNAERLQAIAAAATPFLVRGKPKKGLSPLRALRRIHNLATSEFPDWDRLPGCQTQADYVPRAEAVISHVQE